MRIRRIAAILALVGLAVVLAPLVYGVGRGWQAGTDGEDRLEQAYALLEAYLAQSPPDASLPYINFDSAIAECGYERDRLFAADDGPTNSAWTPYGGYWDMFLARSVARRDRAEGLRADLLRIRTTAFSSEFLRICLRQSLLAPLCARRVSAILEAGGMNGPGPPPGPQIDESRRTRNICTYLDGIAARRGLPLAVPAERGSGQ
jgi:hypothetical protein